MMYPPRERLRPHAKGASAEDHDSLFSDGVRQIPQTVPKSNALESIAIVEIEPLSLLSTINLKRLESF